MTKARVVFFGSGAFGLATLERLAAGDYEVVGVVTQPDRPAGRGGHMRSTPIKKLAEASALPVLQPETPNTPEFAACLARLDADLAVIVAYGHLIKKPLLDIPRRGFVNLHASLLPAYRGAAPVPWAILSGDAVSGATVFSLNERFDEGGIVGQVELAIDPEDTSGSYLDKLAPVGADLVARVLPDFLAGTIRPLPQDDAKASRAPKFTKHDGVVDWNLPLRSIHDKVRALQPWPLAHTELPTPKGKLGVNILAVLPAPSAGGDGAPGDIVAADAKTGLVVMAGDGPVRLTRFQPEGKRPMQDTEFLRGTKILL